MKFRHAGKLIVAGLSTVSLVGIPYVQAATPRYDFQSAQTNVQAHTALSFNKLSWDGSTFDPKNRNSQSEVAISSASIQGDNVTVSGSVTSNGISVPFNLQGNLVRSPIPNRIYGELADSLGNFNVVRFEFTNDPAKNILIDKTLKGPTLALYLEVPGTRNITFLEEPLDNIFSSSDISSMFSGIDQLPLNAMQGNAETWMSKLFTPKIREIKGKPQKGTTITPNTSSPYFWQDQYWCMYSGGIAMGQITDTITLDGTVEEPVSASNNPSLYAQYAVDSVSYYESAPNQTYTNMTDWWIGATGPDGFTLSIPYPEYLAGMGMSAHTQQGPSVSFNLSWGLSAGGFSGSWSYTPGQTYTTGNITYVPKNPSEIHGGQVYLNNQLTNQANTGNSYLQYPGDYVTDNYSLDYLTGATPNQTVTDEVDVTYDLYNYDGNFNSQNITDVVTFKVTN